MSVYGFGAMSWVRVEVYFVCGGKGGMTFAGGSKRGTTLNAKQSKAAFHTTLCERNLNLICSSLVAAKGGDATHYNLNRFTHSPNPVAHPPTIATAVFPMPPFLHAFLPPVFLPRRHLAHNAMSHKSPRRQPPVLCTRAQDPITASPLGPPVVICVGEALFDLLTSSPTAAMADSAAWTAFLGGSPTNLATALAQLSTASALVGRVGDDEKSEHVRATLKRKHVNVDGMQTAAGRKTRRVFVRRTDEGESSFVGFDGDNAQFADATALDVDALPGVLFYAAHVLVTGTLCLAFKESARTVVELGQLAKMCKLKIVVDVNWRSVFWDGWKIEDARERILRYIRESPGADIVKATEEEVDLLFGEELAGRALEDPTAVLRAIGGPCMGVVVTGGSKGASYSFSGGGEEIAGQVPAILGRGEVVDTTGAGDAFLAGFLSEMLKLGGPSALTDGNKAKKVVEFGVAVASFVVRGEGSIDPQPSREMVEEMLVERVS